MAMTLQTISPIRKDFFIFLCEVFPYDSMKCFRCHLTIMEYTTLIKQPRFGNLSKSFPIVNMKISIPDSDLAPILYSGYMFLKC